MPVDGSFMLNDECEAWKRVTKKEMLLQRATEEGVFKPRKSALGMSLTGSFVFDNGAVQAQDIPHLGRAFVPLPALTTSLGTESPSRGRGRSLSVSMQLDRQPPSSPTSPVSPWGRTARPPRSKGGAPIKRASSAAALTFHGSHSKWV
mmetsp:Transcript_80568/g.218362  ORF Transcript_80568/g.218362 Transcript_80568/m.218362 type:complete len:148 (-) Transcript_80568:104-547(-)